MGVGGGLPRAVDILLGFLPVLGWTAATAEGLKRGQVHLRERSAGNV